MAENEARSRPEYLSVSSADDSFLQAAPRPSIKPRRRHLAHPLQLAGPLPSLPRSLRSCRGRRRRCRRFASPWTASPLRGRRCCQSAGRHDAVVDPFQPPFSPYFTLPITSRPCAPAFRFCRPAIRRHLNSPSLATSAQAVRFNKFSAPSPSLSVRRERLWPVRPWGIMRATAVRVAAADGEAHHVLGRAPTATRHTPPWR